jgi:transposase InsO family protein
MSSSFVGDANAECTEAINPSNNMVTLISSISRDVDLEARLGEWERFYSFHGPHGANKGKTPYEALREKL